MPKQGQTFRKTYYNGTHGNLSSETFRDVLNAEAVDTEIHLGVIPAGSEVTRLDVAHENLGAGTSIDLGYQFIDPDHGAADLAYFGSVDTTAESSDSIVKMPKAFDNQVILVAKVKGAVASGKLVVMPTTIRRGLK